MEQKSKHNSTARLGVALLIIVEVEDSPKKKKMQRKDPPELLLKAAPTPANVYDPPTINAPSTPAKFSEDQSAQELLKRG